MKRLTIALLVLLLTVATASAVGTITFTVTNLGRNMMKYTVDWVSDGSGDVSGNASQFLIARGEIVQAQFEPDSGGTQPTDLYDATFTLVGIDVLDTTGDNLSNSTGKIVLFDPPLFFDASSDLDLVIANAGASKGGTFTLWVKTNR